MFLRQIFLLGFALGITFEPCQSQRQSGAIWMPSPHHFTGRRGQTAKWLIIHGTAGGSSAQNIGNWFKNPNSKTSTHYVVGRDGVIVQCVDEKNGAWGNGVIERGADSWWSRTGNPNYATISIELVKPSKDNSNTISDAQKRATFNLVKDIIRRNPGIRKGWANASGGITGHYSISPLSRKRCPGPFPFSELFSFLAKK